MSIRRLMAMAAGGLVMTLATGQLSPLHAQGNTSVEADVDIVREVQARNLLEIRLGELTSKMTTHPGVRGFGDRMITDHTTLHKQWTAVAGYQDKFKPRLGQMQVGEVVRLQKVPANQFDREYMATMIRHHEDNVKYFQNAASSARSTQVRQLLANGLPVLQEHLNLAVQVGSQVGAAPAVAGVPQTPSNVPVADPNVPGQNQPPTTAQNPPTPTQNAPVASEISKQDRKDFKKDLKFVREAMADNTVEIELARVAEKNTTHTTVRQLAKRLRDDNTEMQNRWIALAASHGFNLKPGMGRRHWDKVKRLEKTSATEFDRAYATMELQNHQDYVEYFQKEGQATHSAQVREQAASDLRATLRQDLNHAKRVAELLGVDTDAALRARHLSSYK